MTWSGHADQPSRQITENAHMLRKKCLPQSIQSTGCFHRFKSVTSVVYSVEIGVYEIIRNVICIKFGSSLDCLAGLIGVIYFAQGQRRSPWE